MSDYKRLISYVYMYQKQEKGRNVGFVKLESRNGQCKIGISLKGIPSGNMDMEVFLYSYKDSIPAGKIYIRNGQGESRIVTEQNNLVGSNIPFNQIGGLKIQNKSVPGIYYATIWDDALMNPSEDEGIAEEEIVSEQSDPAEIPFVQIAELHDEELADGLKGEMQKIQDAEGTITSASLQDDNQQDNSMEAASLVMESLLERILASEVNNAETGSEEFETISDSQSQKDNAERIEAVSYKETPKPVMEQSGNAMDAAPKLEEEYHNHEEQQQNAQEFYREAMNQYEAPPSLEAEEPKTLWDTLELKFPKVRCIASEKPHQVLSITPQDIGILPRECWVFGNNSFLLHGYYQYRYLVLIRMSVDDNKERYLIGVPGVYHNNERFMATMFGFPSFYLARKQTSKAGQFGYWCSEVKIS